jgi:hypothetical protein
MSTPADTPEAIAAPNTSPLLNDSSLFSPDGAAVDAFPAPFELADNAEAFAFVAADTVVVDDPDGDFVPAAGAALVEPAADTPTGEDTVFFILVAATVAPGLFVDADTLAEEADDEGDAVKAFVLEVPAGDPVVCVAFVDCDEEGVDVTVGEDVLGVVDVVVLVEVVVLVDVVVCIVI